MAPRKNAKRAEEEPVETAAVGGDITPPKKKKNPAKAAPVEDAREVRLPRAAKNKKPEPIVEPVVAPTKKPVKLKAVKKTNSAEEEEETTKTSRAKAPAKKTTSNADEPKEVKPKARAKKTVEDPANAAGEKKTATKGKAGAKKAETIVEPKEKEVKPKGRVAKKTVENDEATVEVPAKVSKSTPETDENGDTNEPKENGNTEHEEQDTKDVKKGKKVKGKQPAKKGGKVAAIKNKLPETEDAEEDVIDEAVTNEGEDQWSTLDVDRKGEFSQKFKNQLPVTPVYDPLNTKQGSF